MRRATSSPVIGVTSSFTRSASLRNCGIGDHRVEGAAQDRHAVGGDFA